MKYTVHLYPVVRVQMQVEAESQEQAIAKAEVNFGLYDYGAFKQAEYGEEIPYVLVDEEGDTEYSRSKWYKFENGKPVEGK